MKWFFLDVSLTLKSITIKSCISCSCDEIKGLIGEADFVLPVCRSLQDFLVSKFPRN